MKKRNIFIMILLTIVTFGIYKLYWTCSFQADIKRLTGKGFNPFVHLLLIFVTLGLYMFYWNYIIGSRLQELGGTNNGVLYLVLTILIFPSFLTAYLIQAEANKLTTDSFTEGNNSDKPKEKPAKKSNPKTV